MTEDQIKEARKSYRIHARIFRCPQGILSSLSLQTAIGCGSVSYAVERIYGIQLGPTGVYFDDPKKAKEVYDQLTRDYKADGSETIYEGRPLYG